ncbi:MAG: biotin--[acetyl-CoA-carboxylase] ligase, partial [Gluconobacter sp.]
GRHLAVQRGETYITGSFSGLDEQGRLLLALPGGETIPVVTGDILLG